MGETSKPPKKNKGQFVKGDPRINAGGRPKKPEIWDKAEQALLEAVPRLLLMHKNELQAHLASNPPMHDVLAARFISECPKDAINRFLGKVPLPLTGAEGAPLIPEPKAPLIPPLDFSTWKPEQIERFIDATGAAIAAKMVAPKS